MGFWMTVLAVMVGLLAAEVIGWVIQKCGEFLEWLG